MQSNQSLTRERLRFLKRKSGFPLGSLEAILQFSLAPVYTLCPNPFLDDFISSQNRSEESYITPSFASDVIEGKFDPLYSVHTYHAKVPPRAIMRYILHYTKPGDIIFDGFCGSGMTGLATQLCNRPPTVLEERIESQMPNIKWGFRRAILCDLSPSATFISANYNYAIDSKQFIEAVNTILAETKAELSWMYQTNDPHHSSPMLRPFEYTIWSDVFSCINCGQELVYWNEAMDSRTRQKKKEKQVECSSCGSQEAWNNLQRVYDIVNDPVLGIRRKKCKEIPILIIYRSSTNKRCEKLPDEKDLILLNKIVNTPCSYWYPINPIPQGVNTAQPRNSHDLTHVHHFYPPRSLHFLTHVWYKAKRYPQPLKNKLIFWIQSLSLGLTYLNRFFVQSFSQVNRYLKGTLYIAPVRSEINPFPPFQNKAQKIARLTSLINYTPKSCIISTQSSTDLWQIPANSIDYIFIDPPFGGNLNYSELNFLWESWLKVFTNPTTEAIENKVQKKGIRQYKQLMEQCFAEFFRILKPQHWMTVAFHNSKKKTWLAIQESILKAGFIINDVHILDKKQSTMKQLTTLNAVAKDLIISTYKPIYKKSDDSHFRLHKVDTEVVWNFLREHLKKLSIDSSAQEIAERQARVLFDRVVAYLIENNCVIPLSAPEFYEGLNKRFIEQNELYYLSE